MIIIRAEGNGGFSHWGENLYSSSDNADPRTNGRRYIAIFKVYLAPVIFYVISVVPSLLHERMLLVWLSSRRLCHGDSVDNAKGLHGHVSQPYEERLKGGLRESGSSQGSR